MYIQSKMHFLIVISDNVAVILLFDKQKVTLTQELTDQQELKMLLVELEALLSYWIDFVRFQPGCLNVYLLFQIGYFLRKRLRYIAEVIENKEKDTTEDV